MQKLILFCAIFFTITACSKKGIDNDPVLYRYQIDYQLKLSDLKRTWTGKFIDPTLYDSRYTTNTIGKLTIQDEHNFAIQVVGGNPQRDTTMAGTWQLTNGNLINPLPGGSFFSGKYIDRTDTGFVFADLGQESYYAKTKKDSIYINILITHLNGDRKLVPITLGKQ